MPISAGWITGLTLAYGIFSYGVLALGALSQITLPALIGAATIAACAGAWIARWDGGIRPNWPLLGLALLLALPFAHALAVPPFKEDDLMYHLWVPRQMALSGSLLLDPFSFGAHFPMVFEYPLTLFELAGARVSPFLVNVLVLVALAYALLHVTRRMLGLDVLTSVSVVASVLAVPVVFDLAHSAYVELFFTLELVAVCILYATYRESSDHRRWLLACAVAGLAAGTKYYGILLAPALVTIELIERRRTGAPLGGVAFGIGVAFFAAVPFYAKNLIVTGNPVFPFASSLFPSPFLSPERAELAAALSRTFGARQGWEDYVFSPLRVAGLLPTPVGSRFAGITQISAAFLLAFLSPLARTAWARFATAVFAAFFLLWLTQVQLVRYLYPFAVLPIVIGAAVLATRWRYGRALTLALALGAIVQSTIYLVDYGKNERLWELLSGDISDEEFLGFRYKQSHAIARRVNDAVDPKRSKIMMVGAFGRAYYYDAPTLSVVYFDTEPFLSGEAGFWRFVRDNKITHVSVNWAFVASFHATDGRLDVAATRSYLSSNSTVIVSEPPFEVFELKLASLPP